MFHRTVQAIDGISAVDLSDGQSSMFKSLQGVFTNMIQGIMLGEGSVDELVTIAGEELAEVR